jgi:3'-phosphoadenosine 5'-phosphosulfate sulfotransferase (PAPS reductase)/FAD synthetase
MSVDYARINNTFGKFSLYLADHESICVSVSGGSDSDIIVHIICTQFREYLPKIHFVFANTGIEYRATLRHLDDLEQKYDIKIDRVTGMPIPLAVRKYGVPFVSKQTSEYLQRLQKHGFQWEDETFQELWEKYPKCKVGVRFWTNDWGEKSRFNINWQPGLKEFLIGEKPCTRFSSECCTVSKKGPLVTYQHSVHADLYITGERKSEGGARAGAHSSCFEKSIKHGMDHFMPLWFWDDETKAYYTHAVGLLYSDCYEVWGLKRTGCVGCPFAREIEAELELIKQYEPQCYKLCMNVFGEAYALQRKFKEFKEAQKQCP